MLLFQSLKLQNKKSLKKENETKERKRRDRKSLNENRKKSKKNKFMHRLNKQNLILRNLQNLNQVRVLGKELRRISLRNTKAL